MAGDDELLEGVEVSETRAGRFQVEVKAAGVIFFADEPVSAGGLGSGPGPYDLLCAALGSCTAMTLRLYAEHKAWTLRHVAVRVVHRRDPVGLEDRFAREIVLEGELSDSQRQRLLEIANHCPVHRTLERGSQIVTVLAQTPLEGHLDPEPLAHMAAMEAVCASA